MKRAFRNRGKCLSHWQAWVCLMLVALVLYNPFAGLWSANDGLSYDRLARNRATVGASELQHFSPISSDTAQAELVADLPSIYLIQVVCRDLSSADLREGFAPQTEFFTHLSNRPPPSL